MFSAVQETYVKSLIEVMRDKGYSNYIARTITETGNNYKLDIIFSQTVITGSNLTSYSITNGIRYQVDSSAFSQNNNHARVSTSTFSGAYTVPVYEFVYTNAEFTSSTLVQPDIRHLGGVQSQATTYLLFSFSIFLLLYVLFRLMKSILYRC